MISVKGLILVISFAPKLAMSDNHSSNFKDVSDSTLTWLERVEETERLYCGALCSIHHVERRREMNSWCDFCRCDDDCFEVGNCCREMISVQTTTQTSLGACDHRSLEGSGPHHDYGIYLMRHRCLLAETGGKCQDADDDDWISHTPVDDPRTGTTYVHRACAVCNNVTEGEAWTTILVCDSATDILNQATSLEEIYIRALVSSNCDAIFSSPDVGNKSRKCTKRTDHHNVISGCNVTGNWVNYDQNVEYACYNLPRMGFGAYKNMFCYACNTNTSLSEAATAQTTNSVRKSKLIAVLESTDEDALVQTNTIRNRKSPERPGLAKNSIGFCQRGTTSSNVTLCTCRQLTCVYGRFLVDETCKPVVIVTNMYGYRICLHIRLDFTSPVEKGRIWKYLRVTMDTLNDTLPGNIVLKTSSSNVHVLHNAASSPVYVVVHVLVEYASIPAVDRQWLEWVSLEAIINTKIQLHTTFDNVTVDVGQMCSQNLLTLDTGDNTGGVFSITSTDDVPEQHVLLVEGVTYLPINNQVFCPIVSLDLSECSIEAKASHPRIMATDLSNEFLYEGIFSEYFHLKLQGSSLFIDHEYFIVTDKGTVTMCADVYVRNLPIPNMECRNETLFHPLNVLLRNKNIQTLSIIAVSISAIFLVVTFVMMCLSPSSNVIRRNLQGLLISLICAQVLHEFGADLQMSKSLCAIIGLSAHLTLLSALFWLNSCSTVTLMLVVKGRPLMCCRNRIFLVSSLYSVILPLVLLAANLAMTYLQTGDFGYHEGNCFLKKGKDKWLYVIVVVSLSIASNLTLYLLHVFKWKSSQTDKKLCLSPYAEVSLVIIALLALEFMFQKTDINLFGYLASLPAGFLGVLVFLEFVCNDKAGIVFHSNQVGDVSDA